MGQKRIDVLKAIGKNRNSEVLLFVTGDKPGFDTQIAPDVINMFDKHLKKLKGNKLTLALYSRGGVPLVAWNLVNLIREYVKEFEVIVIEKAHSTATLIALGADTIIMPNNSTLGPVDPTFTL